MKKLIALLFCLAVVAGVARAEYPGASGGSRLSDKLTGTVNGSLRVVSFKIYPANAPDMVYTGKAVIIGFNNNLTSMDLLLDPSLSAAVDDINDSGDTVILGQVKVGMVKPENPARLTFRSVQIKRNNRNETVYKATLPTEKLAGNNAHNAQVLKNISVQQATKLL